MTKSPEATSEKSAVASPSVSMGLDLWQNPLKFEAFGVRTAAAITVPFIAGQLMGYAAAGLMIGLGALYVSVTDKQGARLPAMLAATAGVGVSALVGSLVGSSAWATTLVMFIWAFLGGMACVYGQVATNVGFVITLSFAVMQGISADPHTGLDHLIEFGVGGLWATVLTLLLWRFVGHSQADPTLQDRAITITAPPQASKLSVWLQQFGANLTWRSVVFQHALRLSVAATIAVALYKTLHIEHGYWLIITVLVIVKPDLPATRQRALERMVGSMVGGLLGVLLAALIHNVVALNLLLIVLAVLAFSHSPNNYGLYVVFLTPFVVLMLNIAAPGHWQIGVVRIFDNLAGGILALAVAYLLRPKELTTPLTPAES